MEMKWSLYDDMTLMVFMIKEWVFDFDPDATNLNVPIKAGQMPIQSNVFKNWLVKVFTCWYPIKYLALVHSPIARATQTNSQSKTDCFL